MNHYRLNAFVLFTLTLAVLTRGLSGARAEDGQKEGTFAIVSGGRAVPVVIGAEDFRVVSIAANDFAADVERVSGMKPMVQTNLDGVASGGVLIGTLGRSSIIDGLVRAGRLDVENLTNQWESFLITVITNPFPGIPQTLAIVGSDRRGTAFGVYELSQMIGVSPWYWWADVAPEKRSEIMVNAATRKFGPPSVQYRGIFLNDEDWGLHPWAAKTFDPQTGGIGPTTYGKIFELLLRLKANTLWPAMHECTRPFNSIPENAHLADDYAIVMGSSHAEPMLRNNVGEWADKPERYNYATNRDGVGQYWETRVAANGLFENIYTVGMRGIHDSAMQGPKTAPEQIKLLEQIFADQRALLAKYVKPRVEQVPQMFCPYKEVLGLFRGGLKVPDDVTIVLPDDNFGYIRNFPTPSERQRSGGFGIYYHISYLGRPLSYLWLNTTPPALIWEEMSKAYDHGAQKIWIVNVGDLKPGEIGVEFFLQTAWNIRRWRHDNLPAFLVDWAQREFGDAHAKEIASIMEEYYQLNFQRKPEHLQWWLSGQPKRPSEFTPAEARARSEAFARIAADAERVQAQLPASKHDSFFELVGYPVRGSALVNERFLSAEEFARQPTNSPAAFEAAQRAQAADVELGQLTRYFNERVAGGKWNGMLAVELPQKQWRSMRIEPFTLPSTVPVMPGSALKTNVAGAFIPAADAHARAGINWRFIETNRVVSIKAGHFSAKKARGGASWEVIPGLGRGGEAVALFPTTASAAGFATLAPAPPFLDYEISFTSTGEFPLTVYMVPTFPLAGNSLNFAIGLDDEAPRRITVKVKDGSSEWAQGVLNAALTATTKISVPSAGSHTLRLYGVDVGVVIDKLVIDSGGLQPSYLGPDETLVSW